MKKILLLFVIIQNGLIAQIQIPQISQEQKIIGLSTFWKEASYNFANFDKVPKLNWDSAYAAFIPRVLATKNLYEYSREMKKFCALLHDGHTNTSFYVDTLMYRRSFGKYEIELKEFENKIYVINTALKTKDEIPLGSEILSVDNIPAEKYLTDSIIPYISSSTDYARREDAVTSLLSGLKGTSFTVQFKTPENKIKDIKLTREKCSDKLLIEPKVNNELINFKWLDDNIAYVALNSFMDIKIDSLFKALIPELQKCKGLIIDIRENEGGNDRYANLIIKHLTDKPYFFMGRQSGRVTTSLYKAKGNFAEKILNNAKLSLDTSTAEFKNNYATMDDFRILYEYYLNFKGKAMKDEPMDTAYNDDKSAKLLMPLIVLIGNNTASAAENFSIGLDYLKRATFVGQRTFGSTGQPLSFTIPGGGFARVCSAKTKYPDGREFVGVGIKPDVEVNITLKDYLENNDKTLLEATKIMKTIIKKKEILY